MFKSETALYDWSKPLRPTWNQCFSPNIEVKQSAFRWRFDYQRHSLLISQRSAIINMWKPNRWPTQVMLFHSKPVHQSTLEPRNLLARMIREGWNVGQMVWMHPCCSSQHMTICGLSLHQGNMESRKNLEQKFIFLIGTLNPYSINERFSFN